MLAARNSTSCRSRVLGVVHPSASNTALRLRTAVARHRRTRIRSSSVRWCVSSFLPFFLSLLPPTPTLTDGDSCKCACSVRLPAGASADDVWAQHAAGACDGAYRARAVKQRCPVAGCHEKLLASSSLTCKTCATPTCLRHRFSDQHGCSQRVAAARQAISLRRAAAAPRAVAPRPAAVPQGTSVRPQTAVSQRPAVRPQPAAYVGANSVSGSAERRTLREVCPHCQQRFADVVALVNHCTSEHEAAAGRNSTCEVC